MLAIKTLNLTDKNCIYHNKIQHANKYLPSRIHPRIETHAYLLKAEMI